MPLRVDSLTPGSAEHELATRMLDLDRDGVVSDAEIERVRADLAGGKLALDAAARAALDRLLAAPAAVAPATGTTTSAASVITGAREVIDAAGDLGRLTPTQRQVVAATRERAQASSAAAHAALLAVATRAGHSEADLVRLLAYIKDEAPITVSFNPDKALQLYTRAYGAPAARPPEYRVPVDRTLTLIDAFLVDDRYRNQFETGVTSGSNTAYPGGSRDQWEKTIFVNGYHGSDLVADERPKYGAMNPAKYPTGPASHYGVCYFVLKPGVRARTTFTPRNSSSCNQNQVGTVDHFEHVMRDTDQGYLTQIMQVALGKVGATPAGPSWQYIEAQIHGPLEFGRDVDHMVLHTRFRSTSYEEKLRRFAGRFAIPIKWTDGREVLDDAPPAGA